jgi:hypothetical protein
VSDGLAVRVEGEKAPARPSTSGSGKSGANGRPSREEIAKIIKANNLTLEEFRGMDIPERRKLIAQWRQQNAAKE